jgi:hypothetical protein
MGDLLCMGWSSNFVRSPPPRVSTALTTACRQNQSTVDGIEKEAARERDCRGCLLPGQAVARFSKAR